MKALVLFGMLCCAPTILPSNEAASREEEPIQFHFEVNKYQQLAGTINIGYFSLGGAARLPVQLEHYVQKTLNGDISMFSISPIETYVKADLSIPDTFLWHSPLGGTVRIPRPPLGFYTADNISYRFANEYCTIGLSDESSLVYRAGLLHELLLPDGTVIDCQTKGGELTALRRGSYLYLKTNREPDSLTLSGNGERAEKVTFQFKFNRSGQVVSFSSPNGTGTIKYDAQGLISSASSTHTRVFIKKTAVAFWDYKKRQRGLVRDWSIMVEPNYGGSFNKVSASTPAIDSRN